MKRILIILAVMVVSIMIMVPASTAVAWSPGSTEVGIEFSPVWVEGYPWSGSTQTVHGSITIDAKTRAVGLFASAEAQSQGKVIVRDPEGELVLKYKSTEFDEDWGIFFAWADASQVWEWEYTFFAYKPGTYTLTQKAIAKVKWSIMFGWIGDEDFAQDHDVYSWTLTKYVNPWDKYYGKLYVQMFYPCWSDGFAYVEKTPILISGPQTLAEDVELIGRYLDNTYKLVIPAGTIVDGSNVTYLLIKLVGGQWVISPDLTLSKPAIIYQDIAGEWVPVYYQWD